MPHPTYLDRISEERFINEERYSLHFSAHPADRIRTSGHEHRINRPDT